MPISFPTNIIVQISTRSSVGSYPQSILTRVITALIDVRGCRHSGFRHSGFSPRGLDVRGSDVRGRLFWTLGFRTFGVLENGRSGLNPERLKMNPVSSD